MLENEQELNEFLKEFENSQMDVDAFIKQYLQDKGVENPEGIIQQIDETGQQIDENYEMLQTMKAEGKTRKDFLAKICDKIFEGKDSKKAGEALSVVMAGLIGDENFSEEDARKAVPYEDFDKEDYLKDLDDAITCSALKEFIEDKEAEEE